MCPSVSYWIALTTPNGAPTSPLAIHRALLECRVDVFTNQVRKRKHEHSYYEHSTLMSYIKRNNFNTLNFEKHRIGKDTNINKCVYVDRNLMLNLVSARACICPCLYC